jgi:hypothetical protein
MHPNTEYTEDKVVNEISLNTLEKALKQSRVELKTDKNTYSFYPAVHRTRSDRREVFIGPLNKVIDGYVVEMGTTAIVYYYYDNNTITLKTKQS